MNAQAAKVLQDALQLSESDRADLAARLYESIEGDFADPEVEAAWGEEIKRRLEEIDSGKVKMIPWEEVRKELWAKIKEARHA